MFYASLYYMIWYLINACRQLTPKIFCYFLHFGLSYWRYKHGCITTVYSVLWRITTWVSNDILFQKISCFFFEERELNGSDIFGRFVIFSVQYIYSIFYHYVGFSHILCLLIATYMTKHKACWKFMCKEHLQCYEVKRSDFTERIIMTSDTTPLNANGYHNNVSTQVHLQSTFYWQS
jgi:hypothetical protein